MIRNIEVYINGLRRNILFLRVSRGHGSLISSAFFQLESKDFDIGNSISIDVKVDSNTYRLFYGYVKEWTYTNQDGLYEFVCSGVLSRSKDHFIVASSPNSSYKIRNKYIEHLIGDLLNMAGITSYVYEPTNFRLAVTHDYEINLINNYDMIVQAKKIVAYEVYDDEYGTVYLKNRKPYIMSSDSSYLTINEITDFNYLVSDVDLRNRVVVYGDNVYAERKVSSPYLPVGYYRTVVLASNLIQSQTFADLAADYNLSLLNRLKEELTITKEIVPFVQPFRVITLNTGISTIDGDWYVYNVETEIRLNEGALQTISLRR